MQSNHPNNSLQLSSCLKDIDNGVILHVRVTPKAVQSKVLGLQDNVLKVAVKAHPVDGAANKELIRFLSKMLGIPKSCIAVIHGETSRNKQIFLQSKSFDEIQQCINDLLK